MIIKTCALASLTSLSLYDLLSNVPKRREQLSVLWEILEELHLFLLQEKLEDEMKQDGDRTKKIQMKVNKIKQNKIP